MALNDEEQAALEAKLQAAEAKAAEAAKLKESVESLTGQIDNLKAAASGKDASYLQSELAKAIEKRQQAKAELAEMQAKLETLPAQTEKELKEQFEKEKAELQRNYAVERLLAEAGADPKTLAYAKQELDKYELAQGEDGAWTGKIGDEAKPAEDVLSHLREQMPAFFKDERRGSLRGSPAGGKAPTPIKDSNGNLSTKLIDARATAAFDKES